MSPAGWLRVKEEVGLLLELPPKMRTARLAEIRAEDPELAAEVESLLDGAGESSRFLETPAVDRISGPAAAAAPEASSPAPDLAPPSRIGPWRVVREIGRGGMGSVFLGQRDDGAFNQQVAIKFVRPELASELLRRRFLAERRILAGLDHPNIAHLLDGGATPEGVPFLVLEYVDGETIDRYCDDRKLPLEARLLLFMAVCEAVQHAHRKLVLHRDIKAANVLVTREGAPKLLDFGVARLLAPESGEGGLTALGFAAALTPEWASPEQLRGELLTTASDVYSLGVLLFTLLTGGRPFALAGDSTAGLAAEIVASPAPRLAAAAPGVDPSRLRGDLVWIAQKAIAAEPSRRYATAAELAADVGRYFAGSAVEAHPPAAGYRLGKFLRRHRAAVFALAIAATSLVAATAVSLRQAAIAGHQRVLAERRFDDVRRLAHVVLFDLSDALTGVPGALAARRLLVENALKYLDSLASEVGDEPDLLSELATAYERVADLQGTPNWPGEGRSGDALASLERALALRVRVTARRQAANGDVDPGALAAARLAEGLARSKVGDTLAGRGETSRARERHSEASAIFGELMAGKPSAELELHLAEIEVALGDDTWELGDVPGAAERYGRALVHSVAVLAAEPGAPGSPDSDVARRQNGVIEQRLGDAAAELRNWPEALRHFRVSLEVDEALDRGAPDNAETLRDLGTDHSRLGVAAFAAGDLATAVEEHERASKLRERLLAADPSDARALSDAAESSFEIAQSLAALGKIKEARLSWTAALERWRDLVRRDPENVRWRDALAQALGKIGHWESLQGGRVAALATLAEAVALRRALEAEHPELAANREALSVAVADLSTVQSGGTLAAPSADLLPSS